MTEDSEKNALERSVNGSFFLIHVRRRPFFAAQFCGESWGDRRTMDAVDFQISLVRPGGVRILSREMVEQIHGLGEEGKLDLKHV